MVNRGTGAGAPIMHFEFATANRVIFGPGVSDQLASLVSPLGRRVLWVTGREAARWDALRQGLGAAGIETVAMSVSGEPDFDVIRRGVAAARDARCDAVVSVGGGSALDAGKAMAMLLTNPGDPLDYAEVIGTGRPVLQAPAPFVAVPTTAGTGSEVTRNAVLGSPGRRVKVSLRSPLMLPRIALVDPDLIGGVPLPVAASAAMDALAQLIEPYVGTRANPLTDAVCRAGILRSARSIPNIREASTDPAVREDLALASLFSGLALAHAGLGAVHGLAAPLGGMFGAPHGAVCAALLAPVMELNIGRARSAGRSAVVERYRDVARWLTGREQARAEEGAEWARVHARELRIPPLRAYGVKPDDFGATAERALATTSMKGNPVDLSVDDLARALAEATG
jgi:alcohol dehydrogenase class IV